MLLLWRFYVICIFEAYTNYEIMIYLKAHKNLSDK